MIVVMLLQLMVEKLDKIKTKLGDIEITKNSNSKIEEITIPKSKTNIEPFSEDEEEYIKYLINRYTWINQNSFRVKT